MYKRLTVFTIPQSQNINPTTTTTTTEIAAYSENI